MINKDLTRILEKHLSKGNIHGAELLLTPDAAVLFIDDLVNLGVRIAGIEIWQYIDRDPNPDRMLEIPGAGDLLDKYLNPEANLVEIGNTIKKFILEDMKHQVPEANMVSLVFYDREIYSFIRTHQFNIKNGW